MAQFDKIFVGIQTIRYYMSQEEFESFCMQAEHDQIWVGDYNPDKMSAEHRAKMEAWGWFENAGAWSIYV